VVRGVGWTWVSRWVGGGSGLWLGVLAGRGGGGGSGVWLGVLTGREEGGSSHSLRSTFHRLHLLRLWTPTIFVM
jgi:hypothetical protein